MHGDFGGMKSQEGVGIKAREWLQLNCNTKIGRIACCQVFVNLNILGMVHGEKILTQGQ